jgi:hypothetical protein
MIHKHDNDISLSTMVGTGGIDENVGGFETERGLEFLITRVRELLVTKVDLHVVADICKVSFETQAQVQIQPQSVTVNDFKN